MTKFYTIGEIFRLQLLKNHEGQPYKDRPTVSRIVNSMNYKTKKTPYGPAKVVSEKEIEKHNKKWK
jgi:hypothetical protein